MHYSLQLFIFYMCRLQNESENVICNSCKTEEADNTWYFIGCGQLQNGSGFMPFSFNILQVKDCFTLKLWNILSKLLKIKILNLPIAYCPKYRLCLQTARQSKNDKMTQMSSDSVQQTLKSNFSHFEILDFSFCQ